MVMTRLEELVKEKQKEIAKSVKKVVHGATGEIFRMVDEEVEEQRYNICLECNEFRELTKQCKICTCFMPMKVKFEKTVCPKGHWNKE
jgi:hypothetical protein